MGASKEMFIRMREEEYVQIPYELRQRFLSEKVVIPDEHQKLWDEDETYRKYYKAYSDAKKALEKYKFDKRHAGSPK